jgi:hypothetical protein
VKQDSGVDLVEHRIEIAFVPGCCLECIIVEGQELGIIFFELGLGPNQYVVQFIIGIVIKIIMGDGILKKFPGNRPFGGGCFFITQGAVFVFVRFLKVIIHPYLPGSVQIEKNRKKYN